MIQLKSTHHILMPQKTQLKDTPGRCHVAAAGATTSSAKQPPCCTEHTCSTTDTITTGATYSIKITQMPPVTPPLKGPHPLAQAAYTSCLSTPPPFPFPTPPPPPPGAQCPTLTMSTPPPFVHPPPFGVLTRSPALFAVASRCYLHRQL